MFQQYNGQTGLPSDMVYDIYRDGEGYLWFATDKGIARYNGIQFETFSTLHGLPDNEIFFFKQDHYGRLWISTFNGELCYYKDGKFHTAANTPFLKLPFQVYDTRFITVHADSSVSIYFYNQANFFANIKGEKLQVIDMRALKIPSNCVSAIIKPAKDTYEVLALGSISRINERGSILSRERARGDINYTASYTQDSVYLFDHIAVYDQHQRVLHRFRDKIPGKTIRIYFKDGKPVVGTDDGLHIDGKLVLKGKQISSITQDVNGNLWIGTLGYGVFKLNKDLSHYALQKAVYNGQVTYSYKDTSALLFATSANKFYKLRDRKVDMVSNVSHTSRGESIQYIDDSALYVSYNDEIHVLPYQRRSGRKVYRFDSNLGPKALATSDSMIFLHARNNIAYVNLKTGQLDYYTKHIDSRIFCMDKDGHGNIWYTTKDMYKLTAAGSVYQPQFKGLSFKWFKFFGNRLIGVTQTGRLVLTNNIHSPTLRYKVVQDECKWGNAYAIDSTHILLSTDGLYRMIALYPYGDSIHYSLSIIDNEFIPAQAEHVTASGMNVHFFKQGDIYSLPIQELLRRSGAPLIAAVTLRTSAGEYDTRLPVSLKHTEAEGIRISIKTLSFDSKDLYYMYSITKDDKDNWVMIQNPEINLVSPGYGDQIVKIKAVTLSGTPSNTYSLRLSISKPFYFQWWFLAVCFIIFCLFCVLAARMRINYLLSKREAEHQVKIKVLRLEYKALNALMNPHFIFNCLNSIQSFINKGNKASANNYLYLLSRLMRQNMHNVSRELVTLGEETELVNNYLQLEKMRFADRFEYSIDIDEGIEDTEILIPALLIQPLVENAIKHGLLPHDTGNNRLWIRISQRDNLLTIEIEDNGVGFSTNGSSSSRTDHRSFALNNIYSRIAQLNELYSDVISLSIESKGSNEGTKVRIEMDIDGLANTAKDRS